jgi:acyl-CoA thioester hydrolase
LPALGVVAETGCRYLRSVSFPDLLDIGIAVEKLGRSSIVYRLGVFTAGEESAAALGRFVHVYVDAATRRSTAVPQVIRDAVTPLLREFR